MPDYRIQPTFPMATVIDAAQRKAQIEQQSQQFGNQQLTEGLQSIGQVGQQLMDRRRATAQALAIGQQLGLRDDVSKLLAPDQALKIGMINKGYIPADTFLQGIHAQMMANTPAAATPGTGTSQPSGTPASTATPPAQQPNGAILASDTTTPIAPPSTPGSQVPITAPPSKPRMLNPAEQKFLQHMADQAVKNRPEPVVTQDQALAAGSVPKGSRIINPNQGTSDKKEQDAYFRDAVRGLQSIRGDQQVKDIETQRNAAISAFNRLKDIEYTGKAPNPVDYVDILGQVYKARTGQAPGEEILKTARQATSAATLGQFWTYATGQQMPGTSKDIAASLKNMVAHMGLQADDLHEGVMQTHGAMVFNPSMSAENVAKLSKVARGKSFAEATGVKPEDFDVHLQAMKWAQDHPNDPRSAAILQKATQQKSGQGGGNVAL